VRLLDEIARLLDACRSPVALEIGRRQAERLAAELGRRPPPRNPTRDEILAHLLSGAPLPEGEPYTLADVYGPPDEVRTLFGVRLVSAGEDRLLVVEGDGT